MENRQHILPYDQNKADDFVERLVGALGEASMVIMTALGHRAGLFDALAARSPASSASVASEAGLAERYVREWLAVMVTSRVVDYDPQRQTYTLPTEYASSLTRAAGANNLAVSTQFLGIAASVEEEMLARFQSGEGLHYHHFERFHEIMAEDSAQTVVASLLEHIVPLAPDLEKRLETGIDCVDVGCGGGLALLRMAKAFPRSRFLGIDLCAEAFARTQARVASEGIENLCFEARDLSGVKSLGEFDLVMAFDAVHDQADPQGLLAMVRRSIRAGGMFLMQDIGGSRYLEKNLEDPFAPLLYTISLMHCTPISIGQGGPGLGAMWGVETAREYLLKAGFSNIEVRRLDHDPMNAYFICRP